ncbi:MAG: AI-2E family transporter [Candidatus Aminicenantes bacterium]|nr:AI-2E family transporter [Candidatus Aminicenantes bacterium]
MRGEELKLPFYAKATLIFIGLFALFTVLDITQNIIVPLVFAIVIAIALHPIVNFLVRLKINRVIAIVLTLALTVLVIAAFSALMISQGIRFSESWPILSEKFNGFLNQTITAASRYFDINPQKIHAWIAKATSDIINTSTAAIGKTIVIISSALVVLFLIPVYVFLILFYKPILLEFIYKLFSQNNQNQVGEIVTRTKAVVQSYIIGLVIEAVLVATLNTMALLILGIDYALLIGIIGGLLNIIPYIGGVVAVALPMMVALVTKSSPWYAFYVLAAYYFIQLVDNNYIVPKIVASKVKINALFAIVVVIAGNSLWGVPGMFLSLPLLAIVKVICDEIEPLKPGGFLLGDTMPPLLKIKLILKKSKK